MGLYSLVTTLLSGGLRHLNVSISQLVEFYGLLTTLFGANQAPDYEQFSALA